jgi:choline dehydrogenase-like flavoprotein
MWLLGGAEQAPNLDSRVTLSDQRDALGSPRVRLDWRLTELDHRTARTMAGAVRDAFRRQGLAEVDLPDWLQPGAEGWTSQVYGPFHPTGTTRMASDPKRGVVDANCRVHGVSNLFVAGSSVFPTSGYANPTFTIIALAIRLADHVRSILR